MKVGEPAALRRARACWKVMPPAACPADLHPGPPRDSPGLEGQHCQTPWGLVAPPLTQISSTTYPDLKHVEASTFCTCGIVVRGEQLCLVEHYSPDGST